MHFFTKYFLMFLFFSSVGWLIESLYCSIGPVVSGKTDRFHFVNRGFLTGPVTPIYGVSCMVMAATLLPFRDNLLLLFVVGLVVCDVVEFATSVIMEKLFHARWWDYTGYFLNIQGRICLRNSLIWGALSIVFIKGIYPGTDLLFEKLLGRIGWEGTVGLTFLLLGIFLADLSRTVVASLSIRDLQKKARKFRDTLLGTGDKLSGISEDIQSDAMAALQDMRSSVNHMTGWHRHRVHRLTEQYPQLLTYFADTREEIMANPEPDNVLKELKFLQMDLKTFFTSDQNEMY